MVVGLGELEAWSLPLSWLPDERERVLDMLRLDDRRVHSGVPLLGLGGGEVEGCCVFETVRAHLLARRSVGLGECGKQ